MVKGGGGKEGGRMGARNGREVKGGKGNWGLGPERRRLYARWRADRAQPRHVARRAILAAWTGRGGRGAARRLFAQRNDGAREPLRAVAANRERGPRRHRLRLPLRRRDLCG